jgi:hypothetical protein
MPVWKVKHNGTTIPHLVACKLDIKLSDISHFKATIARPSDAWRTTLKNGRGYLDKHRIEILRENPQIFHDTVGNLWARVGYSLVEEDTLDNWNPIDGTLVFFLENVNTKGDSLELSGRSAEILLTDSIPDTWSPSPDLTDTALIDEIVTNYCVKLLRVN